MKIIRIASIYNEVDIIQQNLEWYIDDNIETIIIDEGSSDGTYEICKTYLGNGIIDLISIPVQEHDREYSIYRLWQVCKRHSPDIVLLADADEFFEYSDSRISLSKALQYEFSQGYTVIRFHTMEFWMTDKDDLQEDNILKRIRHYSYFSSHLYRSFLYHPDIDLWTKIGHAPILPPEIPAKISHNIFINRHYKFRSLSQAYSKIDRIIPPRRNKDRSFHYLKYQKDPKFFILPSEDLTEYLDDSRWNMVRTFNGWRMNRQEVKSYLNLHSEEDIDRWFKSRTFET